MDFSTLAGINETKQLQIAARTILTENGYTAGKWSLTDIIQNKSVASQYCILALSGSNTDGTRAENGAAADGMRYKLKVLTRQACYKDKDGRRINGWDMLPDDGTDPDGPPIRPEWKDTPQPGDVVMIKGNQRKDDPETGERLTRESRMGLVHRGYFPFHHKDVIVDTDGCITVGFDDAMQLLTLKGQRVVMPQFRKLNKVTKDGTYEGQRQITNWHFKEVPYNYTENKTNKGMK